jgi:hypothetical protein
VFPILDGHFRRLLSHNLEQLGVIWYQRRGPGQKYFGMKLSEEPSDSALVANVARNKYFARGKLASGIGNALGDNITLGWQKFGK